MANVFDYLKWRDDISFDSLNEIDILIFNRIVYFPFEKIVDSNDKISIEDAKERALNIKDYKFSKQDMELLQTLAASDRYKNLTISGVVSKKDSEKEEEFMAMTINLPKNYLYIVFRGTTNDIISWKESLKLSYSTILSQIEALEYLKKVNIRKKIYLGGHSKGGNLAMYAAINASKVIQSRIIKVYNYDGPGFLTLDNKYYRINKKIISYLPNSSIIGRLLNIDHEIKIIDSNKKGFSAHNLYSWQVEKNYLINSSFNEESNLLKKVIDEFVQKVSPKTKEKLIDEIFDTIIKAGIKNINDISLYKIKDIILSYRSLDKESKDLLYSIVKVIYESTKDNIKISINKIDK